MRNGFLRNQVAYNNTIPAQYFQFTVDFNELLSGIPL
jgi:hypothetical protein